jgi:hypothetical protein
LFYFFFSFICGLPKTEKMNLSLPSAIAEPSTGVYFIHGPRGAGKTILIQKLLQLWENKFRMAYVHEYHWNDPDAVVPTHEHYECCCDNLQVIHTKEMVNNLIETKSRNIHDYPNNPDVLILENYTGFGFNEILKHLVMNARHYHLIVLIAIQYGGSAPSFALGSANWLFMNRRVLKWMQQPFRNIYSESLMKIMDGFGPGDPWSFFYKSAGEDTLFHMPAPRLQHPNKKNNEIYILLHAVTNLLSPLIKITCSYLTSIACHECQRNMV